MAVMTDESAQYYSAALTCKLSSLQSCVPEDVINGATILLLSLKKHLRESSNDVEECLTDLIVLIGQFSLCNVINQVRNTLLPICDEFARGTPVIIAHSF